MMFRIELLNSVAKMRPVRFVNIWKKKVYYYKYVKKIEYVRHFIEQNVLLVQYIQKMSNEIQGAVFTKLSPI